MRRAASLPLWCRVLVIVALAACELAIWRLVLAPASAPGPAPVVSLAFWKFIGAIVSAVLGGLQAAVDAVVAFLTWAVNWLLYFVIVLYNGIVKLGVELARGFKSAWGFFRTLYDDVLKPAWQKFWTLFDRVRRWLNDTFAPVFKFLRAVRDELLCFYRTWIRPVLDVIDATRGILRVLETLHIKWAAKLDAQLGAIEDWINRSFAIVLAKINEAINLVDRVVTADGLFQRVAFLRTYARDIEHTAAIFWRSQAHGLSAEERARRAHDEYPDIDPAAPGVELGKYYSGAGGEYDGIIGELAPLWREAAGASSRP